MKKYLILSLLSSFLFLNANIAYAAEPQAAVSGNITAGNAGNGSCNWDPYMDRIATMESGKNCGEPPDPACKVTEYTAIADWLIKKQNRRDASWGRYQFIPSTWSGIVSKEYPQCIRYHSIADLPGSAGYFKNNPPKESLPYAISAECHKVQDWAMIQFTQNILSYAEKNNWCGLLGTNITNIKSIGGQSVLPCVADKAGILNMLHNAGTCSTYRKGNTPHYNYRICRGVGVPIPPNGCDPEKPAVGEITPPDSSTQGPEPVLPRPAEFGSDDPLKDIWVRSLQLMTEQIVATMMQQVQIIGQFFDAKHQLETQRLMQQKTFDAHNRYHPSEQLCEVGTFAKNLAQSERRAIITQAALAKSMIDRALKVSGSSSSEIGFDEDTIENSYLSSFCSPLDNAGQNNRLCVKDNKPDMINADIRFDKTIFDQLSLDVDLLDATSTDDEETIFAMMDQLFMHNSFPYVSQAKTKLNRFVAAYLEMRSLVAIRSVAQNSIAYIVSEKASGSVEAESNAPFLKAMMVDMGIEAEVANDMIGDNPSYYAQMEFLTRQIYYHPDFIANLYDKPANVRRMTAAMTAIKSMQNWQIGEALKRREMLTSILLEIKLREKQMELETKDIPTLLYGQPDYIGP